LSAGPFRDLGNPGIGNYVVPEPSSVVLGLFGIGSVVAIAIRRRRIG